MTAWNDLEVGTSGPPLVVGPLTRTDIVRYEGASVFFNPIHHDEPFALAHGFRAPVSVGMLQAGVLATWATNWLGPENVRSFRVRFKEQVWPDDVLTCTGEVERRDEVDGERRVAVRARCSRGDQDEVVVECWATFVVP